MMRRTIRRALPFFALALLALTGAFALDGNVTWYWFENDYGVEYYRYQLDGESDDGWTVVDWSVSEVTLTVDVSVPHTLYLQQSYDGENWSESSMADSEVFEEESSDLDVLPEESVTTEPEEEVYGTDSFVAVGPTGVSEADMLIYDNLEIDRYQGARLLDFGVGYLNHIPDSLGPKSLGLFASYSQCFRKLGVGEIGLKANVALYTSKDLVLHITNTQLLSYLNCLAMVTTKIGNCDVYGGFGPDFRFTMFHGAGAKLGLAVEAGIRFHRSENVILGLALSDHHYLVPSSDMANTMDVRVFMTRAL